MKAVLSIMPLKFYWTTWHNIPEGRTLYVHVTFKYNLKARN
jgi:hypothetical protein